MRLAQNFLKVHGPDDMASCVLSLLKSGKYEEAVPVACAAAQTVGGANFFDLNALAAICLGKAGQSEASLDYWDRNIRSSPQKLQWLESALGCAWQCVNSKKACELAKGWQTLLENVFLAVPKVETLAQMTARGWQGAGSAGIADGWLKGWLWLKKGEKPVIRIEAKETIAWQLQFEPVGSTADHALYKFSQKLAATIGPHYISIIAPDGRQLKGSPIAVSPATCISQSCKNRKGGESTTILIPAYDDAKATLACLGSVFASLKKNKSKAAIFVAWDQGPDSRLLDHLRRLAARGKLKLLENPRNLGFLASVNRAIGNMPHGDIVLLNADTLVHGNWVDRLLDAGSSRDAATVTALSNEAELMSYPSVTNRGKITRLSQVKALDQAAATLEADSSSVAIPVGVGFCMLIKRRAIDQIGGFDGLRIFRGYGEEVDFCLRASEAGLKNYGAFNVFVGHIGERSFGAAKKALASQNNEAIFKKFRQYRRDYEMFLARREPKELREKLARASVTHLQEVNEIEIRPWSHQYLPPWIKDENCQPANKGAVLFVQPGPTPRALLRIWKAFPVADMRFDLRDQQLNETLAKMGCSKALLINCSEAISETAAKLNLEFLRVDNCDEKLQSIENPGRMFRSLLAAPPESLKEWRRLLKLAAKAPETRFYIFHLDTLWKNAPHPANVDDLPLMADYRPLRPEAFLFFDRGHDVAAWRYWLECHGCALLPLYRAQND